MQRSSAQVIIVTALLAEARPVIAHLELSAEDSGGPFRVYSAAQPPVSLVVCGSGRVAAGAAVAHCGARGSDAGWLNLGIAGHADRPPGHAFLAHRIRDAASTRAWYPPRVFESPCSTAAVLTVDHACTEFPTDELYEMEAAGFYDIAARYSPHELVHCLKIVSDNREQPASLLTRERVSDLVAANLDAVCRVIDHLAELSRELRGLDADPPAFESILRMAHFSVTRRRQLRRALRRWAVLHGDTDAAAWIAARRPREAGAIVSDIEQHLEARPPRLTEVP